MIKKAVGIILGMYLISIVQSCCTEEYDYKWTGFDIQILDNVGEYPKVSESGHVGKKALGLRISMQDTVYYLARNVSIINDCYAMSCGQNYTRLHCLNSISIKTLNDYSGEYPQDADITSLFKARFTDQTEKNYISIGDLIWEINNGDVNKYGSQLTPEFDLYLMDTTCMGGQQQFEINFTLSDGNVLTKQTQEMILL